MLDVVHLSPWIGPQSFGLGPVIMNLATEQVDRGATVRVYGADRDKRVVDYLERAYSRGVLVRQCDSLPPSRFAFSPEMMWHMLAAKPDIVHLHGIWTAATLAAMVGSRARTTSRVVAPHGSMDPWARRLSRGRKWLADFVFEKRNLSRTDCFHAVGSNEVEALREAGYRQPVALIPNGVDEAWLNSSGDGALARAGGAIPSGDRLMLYVGRITPKKGLPMLLQALAEHDEFRRSWTLCIAGVDEFGHQEEVAGLARRLQIAAKVQFVGPVFGKAKRDWFAAADAFVLPSYSEGAPVAIVEALGAGIPVLATTASPWQELVSERCGWWVPPERAALSSALEDLFRTESAELGAKGERGRHLVERKYRWTHAGAKSVELYEWLAHGGSRPEFVE